MAFVLVILIEAVVVRGLGCVRLGAVFEGICGTQVLPSRRDLRAEQTANPAATLGCFPAATRQFPVANFKFPLQTAALGCRSRRNRRRAAGEIPHLMLSWFAARVKPA
jgi:hypothetical protein